MDYKLELYGRCPVSRTGEAGVFQCEVTELFKWLDANIENLDEMQKRVGVITHFSHQYQFEIKDTATQLTIGYTIELDKDIPVIITLDNYGLSAGVSLVIVAEDTIFLNDNDMLFSVEIIHDPE